MIATGIGWLMMSEKADRNRTAPRVRRIARRPRGLAQIVERAVSTWGLPNGYVLGEEAGGAFVAGLRYGERMLYTKNAGDQIRANRGYRTGDPKSHVGFAPETAQPEHFTGGRATRASQVEQVIRTLPYLSASSTSLGFSGLDQGPGRARRRSGIRRPAAAFRAWPIKRSNLPNSRSK
jgi:hypothetical protein